MRLLVEYATYRYTFENPEDVENPEQSLVLLRTDVADPSDDEIKEAVAKVEHGFAPEKIHLFKIEKLPDRDVDPNDVTFRELVNVLNEDPAVQRYRDQQEPWKLYADVPLNFFSKFYGIEARHLERIAEETHHTNGELDFKNGKEVDIYIAA